MADGQKVLVNLATGMEDAERVTVAFLVATAALDKGKQAAIWLTKDAVRLALPEQASTLTGWDLAALRSAAAAFSNRVLASVTFLASRSAPSDRARSA